MRLQHLLILVAATAFGLIGVGNCNREMRESQIDLKNLGNCLILVSPIAVSWSVGLMIISLLPPRANLAALCRQPGFTANWVMALTLAWTALHHGLMNYNIINLKSLHILSGFGVFWPTAVDGGHGVAIAWITLLFSRCWEAEPSLIDRMGRILGVFWIATFVVSSSGWLMWIG